MATKINVWREAARLLGDYRIAALTDDSVQVAAFNDSWDRTIEYVLRQAFWKFALKTIVPDISAVGPVIGYSTVYDLPCDWLRTHAIFRSDTATALECPIDVKHQLEQMHVNVVTIYLRYISSDYADPDTWPEHFAYTVACRLAFENAEVITGNPARTEQMEAKWQRAMQLAVGPDAIPEHPWLRFQLDGSMLVASKWLLDEAMWRFAVKTAQLTGTTTGVSPGYTYAVAKPSDFGRVFHYYQTLGVTEWRDVDFRDEAGKLHSQYSSTVLRYVSTAGENSTTWSDGFRRALLSFLEFEEAKRNPQTPGAVLQARSAAWMEAFKNARLKDDMNERPRFNNVSTLVRSRRGYGNGSRSLEQGW